jgi:HAD superfamily hydrolase (TIGR01484 family)
MRPIGDLSAEVARGLLGVFTDIDDTLTTDGRLPAAAYGALEQLAAAGLAIVPITGRPAGWCDMIARFWPVAGVVGENGAFYFSYDAAARKMVRRFMASEAERRENRRRLDVLAGAIVAAVPGSAVSADQLYREADLAIDYREDVRPLPMAAVERIVAAFETAGAVAKVSSIHVNGWFGAYDKLGMTRRFAAEVLGLDLDATQHRFVFCGDSPNDAPMFGFFANACGVANIHDFAGRLPASPAFVTAGRGAAGFVELAAHILRARGLPRLHHR